MLNSLRLLHPYIKDLKLKKEDYKPEVQIVHEFFDILMERDYDENSKKWEMIRDVVCLGLEYDPAYLLRFLDAFEELKDRGSLEKFKINCPIEFLKGHAYKFKKIAEQKCQEEKDKKSPENPNNQLRK